VMTFNRDAMNDRKTAVLGQMAALADFMHVGGRDAFALLPNSTQFELRALFDALNNEFQELIAQSDREFSRGRAAEDSSQEGDE